MSQNVWATIMPFGPVTNFLLAQAANYNPPLRGKKPIPRGYDSTVITKNFGRN
jgi:hypothetical protein